MPMGSLSISRISWSTTLGTTSRSSAPRAYRENLFFGVGFSRRICCLERVEKRLPLVDEKRFRLQVVQAAVQNRNADDIGSTLRALQSRNRFPKKWLGQHYMVSETMNARIVEAAQIQPDDLVLEIGPGTGSLTKALVDAGAHVIAVEKDPDMASLMIERFHDCGRVQVEQVDFLKWPVGSVMRKLLDQESLTSQQPKLAKVVSNLPFNITTHVIKRLLPMGDVFSRVVLLLQGRHHRRADDEAECMSLKEKATLNFLKCRVLVVEDEAALRLTDAAPAPVDYRPMTILVNFFAVPEYKFKVPRKAFFPEPRVDGGVISFVLKTEPEYPPVGPPKIFLSMINSAFNGKRKMLRNSLQHMFKPSDIQVALVSGGFPETARPEELTLGDFVAFYNTVSRLSSPADSAIVSDWTVDKLLPL